MIKLKKTVQNSFLAIGSILMTLVIIEIILTVYLVSYADSKTFVKYASLRQLQADAGEHKALYSSHHYLGFYPTPNYVRGKNKHNSLGYRGDDITMPKPNNTFRIVCLGGSTTYTTEIKDYKLSYPYLLQTYLNNNGHPNVEVINAGAGNWSSWESLINFQFRVLDLDPDMIIIYHGVNDIKPRFVWPPKVYRGDNYGSKVAASGAFMPSIFEYSTLLRVLMIRAGLVTPHADLEKSLNKRPDTYVLRSFRTQKKKGAYPDGIFKEASAEKMLSTNKPIYFERNIRSMISIAKDHGIEVVLSTFAHSRHFPELAMAESDEFLSAYDENNQLLKAVAEDTDVNFFDFADQFPDLKEYYIDGRHITEAGARVKARLFGEFIISNASLQTE